MVDDETAAAAGEEVEDDYLVPTPPEFAPIVDEQLEEALMESQRRILVMH